MVDAYALVRGTRNKLNFQFRVPRTWELAETELTHAGLMEELYARVKDNFEGGVQWYGETVKLDLESKQLIERTKNKPEKYKLKP